MNALGSSSSPLADVMVDELLGILGDYLSGINARSLLARYAATRAGFLVIDPESLPVVLSRIEAGALMFTRPDRRGELRTRLTEFRQRHACAPTAPETIAVNSEGDIVIARARARQLSASMGARSVAAHKVATVVSELARNIVSYTPGGTIELVPEPELPAVTIRALDRGAGIRNLDAILAGTYRSRTGLGLGIAGSRKLAQSCEIQSGPGGTLIVMKIAL